ncbi:MAG TPA: hypothetical protein VK629_18585 [Steroidobacteraceae bacterium]|nr:hypothetical protein [Steroidobacteraceae bacterium]
MKLFRFTASKAWFALLCLGLMSNGAQADDPKKIDINDETFKCIQDMKPVRGFFVTNLLGKLDDTLQVATSSTGGRYPPGSVVQLVPTEVMVKHQEGWNPATKDWEFFELEVSSAGGKIKTRGATEVVNRFGGNCFACHVAAKPEWDLICEKDHGCAPLPIATDRIVAIQKADPRCKPAAPSASASTQK